MFEAGFVTSSGRLQQTNLVSWCALCNALFSSHCDPEVTRAQKRDFGIELETEQDLSSCRELATQLLRRTFLKRAAECLDGVTVQSTESALLNAHLKQMSQKSLCQISNS